MQNFKSLSNENLTLELRQTVTKEREMTVRVLWLLREVESRMLFAERGYSSLFQYCLSELGYSESAALRRISSMRLLKALSTEACEIIEEKISKGELNLSHLTQVQQHFRQQAKALPGLNEPAKASNSDEIGSSLPEKSDSLPFSSAISANEKLELLERVSNTSSRKCEEILAALNPESAKKKESVKPINENETRVTLVLPNELIKKIERLQNAKAHQLQDASILEILALLVNEEIKREEKKKGVSDSAATTAPPREQSTSAVQKDPESEIPVQAQSRYIPVKTVRTVYKQAGHRCEYTDKVTGKRCESRYKLQIEHYCHPYAWGGSNDLSNLKLLCFTHNRLRAIQVFGESVISRASNVRL